MAADVAAKKALRDAALLRRDALTLAAREHAAKVVAERPFPLPISEGFVICGYAPIRSEFDPRPLMRKLEERGAVLALPVIGQRDEPLTMRHWHPEEPLVPGPHGILQPPAHADVVFPDIVLVPLAAFDRTGHRVGYGAGYYDRTLAHLREEEDVCAVGLAFSVQEVDAVAAASHDEPLDLILTEREIIDLRSD